MANEKTPGKNEAQQSQIVKPVPAGTSRKTGKKQNRSQVGGSAVAGAKSTIPKEVPTTNNPQQQEAESYNRTMRRRMEQMGSGPYAERKGKSPQERRKEKIERRKQKRAEQVESVRRSLPGGKIKTDMSRVTRMVIFMALAIIVLIGVFVALRFTGVLK